MPRSEMAITEARRALLAAMRVEDVFAEVSRHALGGVADDGDLVNAELSISGLDAYLHGYFAEVDLGLDLITTAVRRWERTTGKSNPRVLEVGSGLGLVHRILVSAGFDTTGLEPSGLGFEHISAALDAIETMAGPSSLPLIRGRAEELATLDVGTFDIVCSTYVLEHVESVPAVLDAIAAVLRPDGLSVHLMPNYRIPFDPHFGIPVNAATARFVRKAFASRIDRHPQMWASLNFVTATSLEKACKACGLQVQFDRGVMAETVARLLDEPSFADRHRRLAPVARWVDRIGAAKVLHRWPARSATPMRALISHSSNVAESRPEHG